MRSQWAAMAAAVLALAACAGGDGSTVSTLPFAEPAVTSADTGPADDLAPSQITASTVATPDTPAPCALGDLEFWTSRVVVGGTSADAVIRVRNIGQVWCEPDISGSPMIDPAIEPDVWLEPGGWADLMVGQSGRECFDPALVELAQIDVNGETVVVPTAAVASCGWRLTAFFPNEVAVAPCDELAVVDVDGFVLVHNPTLTSCVLGELVEVDGNASSSSPRTGSSSPEVLDLAAGDAVAFARDVDPTIDCDADPSAGALTFDVAGLVRTPEVVCGAIYETGAGRPWFGDRDGPMAPFSADSFDLDEVLAALDPFDR